MPLAELLFAPHGLVHQSWAPREMRGGGTINADGFGIGWYPSQTDQPMRYRQSGPIWSDQNLPGLAAKTVAGAALAAVRSATEGMAVTAAAAAPFGDEAWLFSHNGVVLGWPDSLSKLAERLPVRDLLTLEASTDSAVLWALVRQRLRAGERLDAALAETAREVLRAAPGSRLNLLVTDGRAASATTLGHSLWLRQVPGSLSLASEPLDNDPSWAPVPAGCLVFATPSRVDITELEEL